LSQGTSRLRAQGQWSAPSVSSAGQSLLRLPRPALFIVPHQLAISALSGVSACAVRPNPYRLLQRQRDGFSQRSCAFKATVARTELLHQRMCQFNALAPRDPPCICGLASHPMLSPDLIVPRARGGITETSTLLPAAAALARVPGRTPFAAAPRGPAAADRPTHRIWNGSGGSNPSFSGAPPCQIASHHTLIHRNHSILYDAGHRAKSGSWICFGCWRAAAERPRRARGGSAKSLTGGSTRISLTADPRTLLLAGISGAYRRPPTTGRWLHRMQHRAARSCVLLRSAGWIVSGVREVAQRRQVAYLCPHFDFSSGPHCSQLVRCLRPRGANETIGRLARIPGRGTLRTPELKLLATSLPVPSGLHAQRPAPPLEVLSPPAGSLAIAERRFVSINARIGQALAGYGSATDLPGGSASSTESSSPQRSFQSRDLPVQGIAGRAAGVRFSQSGAEVAQAREGPMLKLPQPSTSKACCAQTEERRERFHSLLTSATRGHQNSCSPKLQPSSGREILSRGLPGRRDALTDF